jgi:hypothetical protein
MMGSKSALRRTSLRIAFHSEPAAAMSSILPSLASSSWYRLEILEFIVYTLSIVILWCLILELQALVEVKLHV